MLNHRGLYGNINHKITSEVRVLKKYIKHAIFILIIIILFLGVYFNLPTKTSSSGVQYFGWWADEYMISDLSYRQNYSVESPFLNGVTMESTLEKGEFRQAYKRYIKNETFLIEEYRQYDGNITAHRYVYALLDKVLPISNFNTLRLFNIINSLLMAIMVAIILMWIGKKTNHIIAFGLAILLAFFAPHFAMFGRSIYWVAWLVLMPMVVSIFVVEGKYLKQKNRYFIVGLLALITCLVKQLCYFEYITTVAVAMAIPYIYYFVENKCEIKEALKIMLSLICGFLVSFVLSMIIIIIMTYIEIGEVAKSIDYVVHHIFLRTSMEYGMNVGEVSDSTSLNVVQVLSRLKKMPAFSIKNSSIYQSEVIYITGAFSILSFSLCIKKSWNMRSKTVPFLVTTWISVLAPLSWIILSTPHVSVHGQNSSFFWFVPFLILAMALIMWVSFLVIEHFIRSLRN